MGELGASRNVLEVSTTTERFLSLMHHIFITSYVMLYEELLFFQFIHLIEQLENLTHNFV
jgi:hypothetical protein